MEFLSSFDAAHAAFLASGVVGLFAHYAKKKLKGETTASFIGWFTNNNTAASVQTVLAFGAAMIGAMSTGLVDGMDMAHIVIAGATAGFAIDSGFNSAAAK